MPAIFWESSAILFVPFATEESKPRKINIGRLIEEPPPAKTFIKLVKIPTPNNKRASKIVGIYNNFIE